jgi:hypothetical protein
MCYNLLHSHCNNLDLSCQPFVRYFRNSLELPKPLINPLDQIVQLNKKIPKNSSKAIFRHLLNITNLQHFR